MRRAMVLWEVFVLRLEQALDGYKGGVCRQTKPASCPTSRDGIFAGFRRATRKRGLRVCAIRLGKPSLAAAGASGRTGAHANRGVSVAIDRDTAAGACPRAGQRPDLWAVNAIGSRRQAMGRARCSRATRLRRPAPGR
jgi:hypothetical protein